MPLNKETKPNQTIKWYIHKPESAPENETQKIWDTNDRLILARSLNWG